MSSIITATDLGTYTGNTLVPGIAAQCAAAANKFIEQRTHRSWGQVVSVTERYDYQSILWLRHPDVQSITSIKLAYPNLTQTTLDPSSYFLNSFGRVTLYWGQNHGISPLNNDLMEVTYTYGVSEVPDDLRLAALGIAAVWYNFAINGQMNVVSSSVGSLHIETIGAIRGSGTAKYNPAMNSAEANFQIIDSYAMRRQ
jgi:hypothetical protein